METQTEDGETDQSKKGKGDGGGGRAQTVTEEEVEEFFVILRRIHVAVKYLERADGGFVRLTGGRWRARFEPEDFEDCDSVINGKKKKNWGLDLNSDPLPIETVARPKS